MNIVSHNKTQNMCRKSNLLMEKLFPIGNQMIDPRIRYANDLA